MASYLHAHSDGGDGVHLLLDPGPDLVGLVGELPPQRLVVLLLAQLVLQRLVALRHQRLHLVPLRVDVVPGEVGVGVDGGAGDVELLGEVLDLLDERHDGLELLVGLAQRRLELAVRVDQPLDLVEGVHDEHVHQVLARPIQPVVEGLNKSRDEDELD